ncbi:hypothetical protein SAMN04487852_106156 [Prevotella sp. tf2-5]|nr:hypothetical protein SAMN04487852_106156 [Prevotella sp. tf2-5]
MVPSKTEPFARLFFLQGCENRLNFAASISETTPELTLQNVSGGTLIRINYDEPDSDDK